MDIFLIWCLKAKRFIRVKDAIGEPAMLFWSASSAEEWALAFWKCHRSQLSDYCNIKEYRLGEPRTAPF